MSEKCFDDRIPIRILFGFSKMTEHEYKYYSVSQKWPNTNTNIIRFPKNDRIRIRILFGYPEMTKYEYYWASQLWPNTNNIWLPKNDQILSTNTNFVEVPKRKASKTSSESHKVMLNSPSPLMTEANYKCKQLPIHMTHPMWLWYMRMNYSLGAQSSFGSAEY